MKNKTRRLAAFLLSAAVVITAVPGMQERVYAQKTGGYTESPKSENVPVVKETKSRLKKAEAVPSAYMNKLSELTIRYPGVRDQGKYDTCWAFSAIGLAEFDLIADNQTADKSIDLSELQLAYFTYNNVEDPLGETVYRTPWHRPPRHWQKVMLLIRMWHICRMYTLLIFTKMLPR